MGIVAAFRLGMGVLTKIPLRQFARRLPLRLRLLFFSSRRRHTRLQGDWSSDVCSSDLFRYDAFTNFGGQSQSGFYVLDASDAGGARTRLQVQGQMGNNPFSSTIILEPNAEIGRAHV